MILRVLTARVPSPNIGQFNELLRAQLTELRTQPGLAYVKLARRLHEDASEEVVLVEEWLTPADLFAWTRGRLTTPRLLPRTEDFVQDLVITHYEALDVSPEELSSRLLANEGSRTPEEEALLDEIVEHAPEGRGSP
ncbi:MAG TPA: antibiotic biosynthesis monooxygenase [Candidatus Limnocylindrales bacterium]